LLPLIGVENAYLVDTPGVREFFNYDPDPENLKFRYKEFLPLQEHCRITNCMHIHEPGCAIMQAVDEGMIPEWRYTSYCVLYAEAKPRL
jgi:ribosome biogenesis GTPase